MGLRCYFDVRAAKLWQEKGFVELKSTGRRSGQTKIGEFPVNEPAG